MGILYITCGVPGSGKSTWCRENVPPTARHISRDTIRYSMVKPNEPYFSKEKEVFNEFVRQIKEGLAIGDVYADATHLNRASRDKLINAVGVNTPDAIVALVFKVPLETCILRNSQRSGREYVPEDQIEIMYNNFRIPTRNERFTKILIKED